MKVEEQAILGRTVEALSPRLVVVKAPQPLPYGEYVAIDYIAEGKQVTALGIVSATQYAHAVPPSALKYVRPEEVPYEFYKLSEMRVYIVAELVGEEVEVPRYPIPPDSPVRLATFEELRKLYPKKKGVRLGVLDVEITKRRKEEAEEEGSELELGIEEEKDSKLGLEIEIEADKLAKHLLIAGATGSGKSNTVAILAEGLAAIGAPVVIFDVHGEYWNLAVRPKFKNEVELKVQNAVLNPWHIPVPVFAHLIVSEGAATKQRRLLRAAIRHLHNELKDGVTAEGLRKVIERLGGKASEEEEDIRETEEITKLYRKALILSVRWVRRAKGSYDDKTVENVVDKIEEFFEVAPISLSAEPLLKNMSHGTVLVIDASLLSDEQKRWTLKLIVDELLERLKKEKGKASAVLVVEEAPLFMGKEVSHPVKESLRKFAREGRKFGGSLVVVSQRPRNLDIEAASQLQNFIFLKMVQEEDVEAVMNIADNLEENLASMIKTFPEGRALVMGEFMGKFPAVVKIDKHKGKKVGATPNLTELWRRAKEEVKTKSQHYDA
ncbi:MAG: ATP-binding protein [Acidilobaceae archaeon]|nr:ATP-binding protein [Acidilobaceae archaeon]